MKIVLAVHHFPPRYTGGAELRAFRTALWLQEHGHDVHVIAVEDAYAGERKGVSSVEEPYETLTVERLSFNLHLAPDAFRWAYDNPWVGDHVRSVLREREPDVFHLIGGYLLSGRALLAAAARGVPTVVSLTDFWFLCPRLSLRRSDGGLCTPPLDPVTCAQCLGEESRRYRLLRSIAPGLMRRYWRARQDRADEVRRRTRFLLDALDRVDVMISPSQFLRDVYVRSGVDPERIVFCRQGRDFPAQTESELRKTSSKPLRLGYMGQIAPHKGVHTLLEAMQLLSEEDVSAQIYGDLERFPGYTQRLQRLAESAGRVAFQGVFAPEELTDVLREIDVLVVPSLWYENSPNTILEAFAHRTPVIAADLGGMAELVEDGGNGLLFEAGDADDLAARVRKLTDGSGLMDRLRKGIEPVKGVQEEMEELVAVYRRATGASKRSVSRLKEQMG